MSIINHFHHFVRHASTTVTLLTTNGRLHIETFHCICLKCGEVYDIEEAYERMGDICPATQIDVPHVSRIHIAKMKLDKH